MEPAVGPEAASLGQDPLYITRVTLQDAQGLLVAPVRGRAPSVCIARQHPAGARCDSLGRRLQGRTWAPRPTQDDARASWGWGAACVCLALKCDLKRVTYANTGDVMCNVCECELACLLRWAPAESKQKRQHGKEIRGRSWLVALGAGVIFTWSRRRRETERENPSACPIVFARPLFAHRHPSSPIHGPKIRETMLACGGPKCVGSSKNPATWHTRDHTTHRIVRPIITINKANCRPLRLSAAVAVLVGAYFLAPPAKV